MHTSSLQPLPRSVIVFKETYILYYERDGVFAETRRLQITADDGIG